ncbi:MAG: hypothetical protein M1819_003945 [Sarea resinae]|nr:MAG: hypothetical protein M1819_003945 [Sarea resinae]
MSLLRPHPSESYRSLPSTPLYGLDARTLSLGGGGQGSRADFEEAMQHARLGVDTDYFSLSSHRGGVGGGGGIMQQRARSPYPAGYCCGESGGGGGGELGMSMYSAGNAQSEMALSDLVRSTVGHKSSYSQLHPKICVDGRFPADFQFPRTVEEVRILEGE